jgi:ATP-dependent RNA helicase RhlE
LYGGGTRYEQRNIAAKQFDIIVANPGTLTDLVSSEDIDVESVTYVVLDYAHVMLNLGFERDIRKIMSILRRDRQTVMTSRTWNGGVQQLARQYMKNPFGMYINSL